MKSVKLYFIAILLLFLSSLSLSSQIAPKATDGLFDDWSDADFTINDADGAAGLDILSVSIADDAELLYILIELDQAIDLQDDQDISVFIDADNDPSTGFSRGTIGAEMTYYFEGKRGFINGPNGASEQVSHDQLGVISLPTVTSDKFELVFDKSAVGDNLSASMGTTISLRIENDSQGDIVPNAGMSLEYTMTTSPSFTSSYSFAKDPTHTRFMSYNVKFDGFFDPNRQQQLQEVITAMNPDVLALQETYDISAAEVKALLESWFPNAGGWDVAKLNPDIIVATRYQIEAFDQIDGNGIFLLIDDDNEPLIIYNLHLPCCDNDGPRQQEIDRILSVLRDKGAAPETGFFYSDNTPTIIAGDFNLVGLSQNYTSFIEGDIVDNANYGADFGPDWDGSTLEDANPYVTNYPSNYTWNNPGGSYNPGKLDFILYTGSVMQKQNAFVLDTDKLPATDLQSLALSKNATEIASDHLPLVMDFTKGVVIDNDGDGFAAEDDCDDNDAAVNPDQTEITYNGIDDDCNPNTLDDDLDQDGFSLAEDCDDNNAQVNSNQTETPYNGIDDDCNPMTLDDDLDQDGFLLSDDCDDTDAAINPDATDIPDNGIDEDCTGADASSLTDSDNDGFTNDVDCDDTDASINPDADEIPYNGKDDDCDTNTLDDDLDQDGFLLADDCDDNNDQINSSQTETPYNGIDDDCDPSTLDDDLDQDGFPMANDCDDNNDQVNSSQTETPYNGIDDDCDPNTLDDDLDQDGFPMADDCDDMNDEISPGNGEIVYDGLDNDCNPDTLDDDLDEDGFPMADDCDDGDATINPDAEEIVNNGIDEDCDGMDLTSSVATIDGIRLKVFPNPTTDFIHLHIEQNIDYKMELYDYAGRLISLINKASSIDTRQLSEGIYLLRIYSLTSGNSTAMRVMVNN